MNLYSMVEDKVVEVYVKAQKHFKKTFEIPTIEYSDTMRSTGGLAYCEKNLIKLNKRMLERNGHNFIDEIVPHEIIHIIEHIVFGNSYHRKRFYEIGKSLGYTLKRGHTFQTILKRSSLVFACKCRTISNLTERTADDMKKEIYKCKKCNAQIKLLK